MGRPKSDDEAVALCVVAILDVESDQMSPPPVKRVEGDSDSEISESDDDESVGVDASSAVAVHKDEGYVDPKHGFILPVTHSGIFLGLSSKQLVTSLAPEDIINAATDVVKTDSLLGSCPDAGRVERSQEMGSFESGGQNEDAIWYAVNHEAEALFQSTGNASHGYTRKANRGKRRPSISLHSYAFGEEKSRSVRECDHSSDHEELEADGEYPQDHRSVEHSVLVASQSVQQEKKLRMDISVKSAEIIPLQGGCAEHSAVELLENLQNKTVLLEDDPNKFARYKRRLSLSEKKVSFTLGDRSLSIEDPSEPICSTSSNDDDDGSEPNLMTVAAEASNKTMADRFHDAIGTSILNDQGMQYAFSKPLGFELSGKLQQVLQDEKDQDAHFLMIRQSYEQTHDESSFLDVKILSTYLEGKLVVCRCCLKDHREGLVDIPETVKENKDRERLLIFNFRICNDVDLDVGNCIRVHSPWKEVRTARFGIIFLCSYFSHKSEDW